MPGASRRGLDDGLLFAVPSLIWGSTWLVIRYQLGVVDPLVSVAYRFLAAGTLMVGYCRVRGVSLRSGVSAHAFMALQGVLLFGVNYWLVYLAELHLPSGLVAVVFCGILLANVLNGRVFLRAPVRLPVLVGGVIGIGGICLIFLRDLLSFDAHSEGLQALGLALVSVYCASLGNTLSARNQRAGLGVLVSNTFGMLYGGASMLALSLALGKPLVFDLSLRYVASLAYLTVLGSIVAFACYLTLLGRIGADRAAYVTLVMPIIALLLTTWVEGYVWTGWAILGAGLVLLGNYVALRRSPD